MNNVLDKAPEWFWERFYENNVKGEIQKNGVLIMDWHTTKTTMIATLNYLRSYKNLECHWMEKKGIENCFLIKIKSK